MYRRRHGAQDVQWSEEMAKRAQAHADTCIIGHQDDGTTVPIGQNLMFSTRGSPEIAVKAWYDEISNYDFNTNQCRGGMCGHFTQVVWAASDKIGCAIANCNGSSRFRMSAVYVVCDYNPMGNVMGGSNYANNVKPLVAQ